MRAAKVEPRIEMAITEAMETPAATESSSLRANRSERQPRPMSRRADAQSKITESANNGHRAYSSIRVLEPPSLPHYLRWASTSSPGTPIKSLFYVMSDFDLLMAGTLSTVLGIASR